MIRSGIHPVVNNLLIPFILLIVAFLVYAIISINNLILKHKTAFTSNLNLSKKNLAKIMCSASISENAPNAGAIKGYTSFTDIGRQNYFINNFKIDRQLSVQQVNDMRNQIKSKSETTGIDYRLQLMNKHKNAIMESLKIDDEICKKLFIDRIVMAAFFEHGFTLHSNTIPNINIIHDIVTNANQAGTSSSPFWFLQKTLIAKIYKADSVPKVSCKNTTTSFIPTSKDKVTCRITSDVTLEENCDILFSIVFTISSKNDKPFSDVTYEDITIELNLPKSMEYHVTATQPIERTEQNQDKPILTDKQTTLDNFISVIYSFPSIRVPTVINRRNTNFILGRINNCQIEASTTQKKQH